MTDRQTGLTGYPSIDKPWLKYYDLGADKAGYNYPKEINVWDFFRSVLLEQEDIPAIEYLGRSISRQQFISEVERWAKIFRFFNVGIQKIVPIFAPALPECCEIFFALNSIAAIPYFMKLDSSIDSIDEESKEARIAVVFDGMWDQVSAVFSKDRFEHVIIISASDSMSLLMKYAVSFALKTKGESFSYKKYPKCVSKDKAMRMADKSGIINTPVPFCRNRIAVITVSSGTTGTGVKGIMDSNESILAAILALASGKTRYKKGKKVLLEMPLMASTSLNCLFLQPLYRGMTIIIDPRLSKDTWFDHVMKYKPSLTICTGIFWEIFFRETQRRIDNGKSFDFSFAVAFIMGGSGTTPEKYKIMNSILSDVDSEAALFSGYGLSEIFGVMSVQMLNIERAHKIENCAVIDVGLPIPGFVISVHDEDGNELKYGERGELWVSSPTIMHGYYNKPELTSKNLIDGKIHTGDIATIDEDGHIYIYGRATDYIDLEGKKTFLFDIANDIRTRFNLSDCIVKKIGSDKIVAFIEKGINITQTNQKIIESINDYYEYVGFSGYKVYDIAFPANPATLKPRTQDGDGFINYIDGKLVNISFG